MHKIYVPVGADKQNVWKVLLDDLHRGKQVGMPTEIEWHPHSAGEPCGDECKVVSYGDIAGTD